MIGRLRALLGRRRTPDEADAARIRREGHVGRAIVVAVEPLRGVDAEGRVETRIRLDVLLPRHRRFTTEIVDRLDAGGRARVRPGAVVPVAADLAELGHVVLDLDQLAVNAEAIAALGPIAGGPGGPRRSG